MHSEHLNLASTIMPQNARNVGNKSRFLLFGGEDWAKTETEVGLCWAVTVT